MSKEKFELLSEPQKIYLRMLEDIENAQKYIYLENYIYTDDEVGRAFRKKLVERAKHGVKVKLLLDAWGGGPGSRLSKFFFSELINLGGEVRFFREFQYTWRIISKNHERNHRKLLLIDDKISYIGSINITKRFIEWRELVLRIDGDLTLDFVKAFNSTWKYFGKGNIKRVFSLVHEEFGIIQDIPSTIGKYTEKKYLQLIHNAKKEIKIETPYFVPSYRMRKAFLDAVRRGVQVKLILPLKSNWPIVDIIRNRYLGFLHRAGVYIYYYKPRMLHSKLLIVDGKFFILGSSNLDYRSFLHNYEINLFGENKKLVGKLEKYFNETFKDTIEFSYNDWKQRSSITRIYEIFLARVRKFA